VLIRKPPDIPASEITPEEVYLRRREFLGVTAGLAVAAAGLAFPFPLRGAGRFPGMGKGADDDELTPYEDVTRYNNFYEFGTGKEDPSREAGRLVTRPWSIAVEGLCEKSGSYDLDDLLFPYAHEERVYRLRCVEAWSMVIPWMGFSLKNWIDRFQPKPEARFVEFTTLLRPDQMPGQRRDVLPWPYVEGLRLDEAVHPLTLVGIGLYGKPLPNQNGAPVRIIIPWKYGFKSIKSIVRVRFTATQPRNTWNVVGPQEYGFYANVNPSVDHPRWSQARERRIGEFRKRPTLMFNGYADQVASLYRGMDLRRNF
jgi:sulfoxide reductase catalytic subunit YedY